MLCNHCDEPSCVAVCPTGATHKREEDGIVVIDADKCVGCRACMTACPYHARYYLDEIRGYYPGQGLTPYEKARYPQHSKADGGEVQLLPRPAGARGKSRPAWPTARRWPASSATLTIPTASPAG